MSVQYNHLDRSVLQSHACCGGIMLGDRAHASLGLAGAHMARRDVGPASVVDRACAEQVHRVCWHAIDGLLFRSPIQVVVHGCHTRSTNNICTDMSTYAFLLIFITTHACTYAHIHIYDTYDVFVHVIIFSHLSGSYHQPHFSDAFRTACGSAVHASCQVSNHAWLNI